MRAILSLCLAALLLAACGSGQDDGCEKCDGCCLAGICQSGNAHDACGKGGGACVACNPGDTCQNSLCVTTCSQDNCAEGCCKDGACQQGTLDNACGINAAGCINCVRSDKACGPSQKCE